MWPTWSQIRIAVMKEIEQLKNIRRENKMDLEATASSAGKEVGSERETRIISRAT